MQQKMSDQDVECITLHTGFKNNCLDRDVIEVSFWHYVKKQGPFDDDHPVNQLYRHVAYRRFTTWIWKLLGKHVRKTLPSCVVSTIRNTFPAQQYVRFKYPEIP
ncbi:uncharacterized protein [Antedon mediterranea]|uniref:uncharacterized protein n=1 Tax=Antedon mediterranea TaxID=105859 RepID=UPI003AF5D94A